MRLLFQILILTIMFAVTGCNIQSHTSSARAAYGNAAPDFKANKKQNQKRKKKARKAAERKNAGNSRSPWYRRPY